LKNKNLVVARDPTPMKVSSKDEEDKSNN